MKLILDISKAFKQALKSFLVREYSDLTLENRFDLGECSSFFRRFRLRLVHVVSLSLFSSTGLKISS